MSNDSKFRISETGFQIDLYNGYTISVQFSAFHHCSNRHGEDTGSYYTLQCSDAEVAVIDPDGEFVSLEEHENTLGYQSVSEVIALINKFNLL